MPGVRTKRKRDSGRQSELEFPLGWGGRRKGAGRKKSPDSGVAHLERERVDSKTPVHVTMKLRGM